GGNGHARRCRGFPGALSVEGIGSRLPVDGYLAGPGNTGNATCIAAFAGQYRSDGVPDVRACPASFLSRGGQPMAMKSPRRPSMKKQRGSALVVVLLIFALAAALSVEVVYRQHRVQTRTANLLDWDYRYQYAIAAETLAIQALVDDYEDDQRNNEMVDDCSKEKWAGPFSFPYEDAVLSATVQDLQGRFNLNSLVVFANNEYQRDQEAIARLEALLAGLLPPSHARYASTLANEMADWLDTDTLVNGPEGAEDGEYRLRRTPNQPILDESEFRALRSFDAELADAINVMQKPKPQATTNNPTTLRFWDYFTALPLGTTLNVNTAPKAVLE